MAPREHMRHEHFDAHDPTDRLTMFRRLFKIAPRSAEQQDAEMREEIETHIALSTDHLIARGVAPDEAARQARARFGNLAAQLPAILASAQHRRTTVTRRETVRAAWRDLQFAIRQAKRSPVLTAGIVLSLGFGIGASATVYSWMQGIILNPLPAVRHMDRLLTIRPERRNGFGVSVDEFNELREQARTVSGLAAASLSIFGMDAEMRGRARTTQPIFGIYVSGNYFDVLGVSARHGRTLQEADAVPGADLVAVISDAAWRVRFGADAGVVGRIARINGKAVRIVGITPSGFGGTLAAARFDLWLPLSALPILSPTERADWRRRDYRWLDVIARLQPGASLSQATAEFQTIGRRQAATFPENVGRQLRVMPLEVGEAMRLEPLFLTLLIVTTLVVLLVCSNVANLLLARASARQREFSIRLSLGASRPRLVSQLLIESSGLALLGALMGGLMAAAGQRILPLIMPPTDVAIDIPFQMNVGFVAFVMAVTGICVLVFGLAPAVIGSRVNLVNALKEGGRGSARGRSAARGSLVVAQFVFALSSLVVALLFLRRDREVQAMNLGFRGAEHVLLLQTELSIAGYRDLESWRIAIERSADAARTVPGVQSLAIASFAPLGLYGYFRKPIEIPEHPTDPGTVERVLTNAVSEGYFDLMGIPVLEGRPIQATDVATNTRVALVNQAFADRYFPGKSVIARTFKLDGHDHVIVGVTANGRYDYRDIDVANAPMVYYAWRQSPTPLVVMHARTAGNPEALAATLAETLHEVDASMPLLAPITLKKYIGVPFAISRTAMTTFTILASAALAVASMGLFSLVSYGVTVRTREVGVRMALGATRMSVVLMFLRGAAGLIAYGTAFGILAALILTAVLRARVPLLPVARLLDFTVPALILGVFALVASLAPARRAAAVDPAVTLRDE